MSVAHLFNAIFNAGLTVFVLTLVTSLGMTFSVKQILEPVRRVWLLAGTVVLNSGLAPLVAIGICHLFPLSAQARDGVELVMIAAGGPACLKSCELAKRADVAMAVSFTIVLQLVNIVAVPLWAKGIITGATVNPWSIVGDLLLLVLAPLVVGFILRGRYPEHRDRGRSGGELEVHCLGPRFLGHSRLRRAHRRLRRPGLGRRIPEPADRDHHLEYRRHEVHAHRPARDLDRAAQPKRLPHPGTGRRLYRHRRPVRDRRRDRALRQPFAGKARPRRPSSGRGSVGSHSPLADHVTGKQSVRY